MDEPANQTTPSPQADLTAYREQYSFYARRLLSDLGLGDLPQPERGQLLAAVESYVQQLLLNTLLENLDPEHIEGADKVLKETNDQDEVMAYLLATVPNIELKMADALAESYAQMMMEARELAKAVTLPKVSTVLETAKTEQSGPGETNNTEGPVDKNEEIPTAPPLPSTPPPAPPTVSTPALSPELPVPLAVPGDPLDQFVPPVPPPPLPSPDQPLNPADPTNT